MVVYNLGQPERGGQGRANLPDPTIERRLKLSEELAKYELASDVVGLAGRGLQAWAQKQKEKRVEEKSFEPGKIAADFDIELERRKVELSKTLTENPDIALQDPATYIGEQVDSVNKLYEDAVRRMEATGDERALNSFRGSRGPDMVRLGEQIPESVMKARQSVIDQAALGNVRGLMGDALAGNALDLYGATQAARSSMAAMSPDAQQEANKLIQDSVSSGLSLGLNSGDPIEQLTSYGMLDTLAPLLTPEQRRSVEGEARAGVGKMIDGLKTSAKEATEAPRYQDAEAALAQAAKYADMARATAMRFRPDLAYDIDNYIGEIQRTSLVVNKARHLVSTDSPVPSGEAGEIAARWSEQAIIDTESVAPGQSAELLSRHLRKFSHVGISEEVAKLTFNWPDAMQKRFLQNAPPLARTALLNARLSSLKKLGLDNTEFGPTSAEATPGEIASIVGASPQEVNTVRNDLYRMALDADKIGQKVTPTDIDGNFNVTALNMIDHLIRSDKSVPNMDQSERMEWVEAARTKAMASLVDFYRKPKQARGHASAEDVLTDVLLSTQPFMIDPMIEGVAERSLLTDYPKAYAEIAAFMDRGLNRDVARMIEKQGGYEERRRPTDFVYDTVGSLPDITGWEVLEEEFDADGRPLRAWVAVQVVSPKDGTNYYILDENGERMRFEITRDGDVVERLRGTHARFTVSPIVLTGEEPVYEKDASTDVQEIDAQDKLKRDEDRIRALRRALHSFDPSHLRGTIEQHELKDYVGPDGRIDYKSMAGGLEFVMNIPEGGSTEDAANIRELKRVWMKGAIKHLTQLTSPDYDSEMRAELREMAAWMHSTQHRFNLSDATPENVARTLENVWMNSDARDEWLLTPYEVRKQFYLDGEIK